MDASFEHKCLNGKFLIKEMARVVTDLFLKSFFDKLKVSFLFGNPRVNSGGSIQQIFRWMPNFSTNFLIKAKNCQ